MPPRRDCPSGPIGENGRFLPGNNANPGGRPKGLSRQTRDLVGEDGEPLVRLWLEIALDPSQKTSDRLEASRLLADRGWGKALASVEIDSRVHHGIETPSFPTITLRGLLDEERLALEPPAEAVDAES